MERLRLEQCKNCNDYNGCMTHCFNICGKPLDALEEFNKYKDLEEQGEFIRLPCAVGDMIYWVNNWFVGHCGGFTNDKWHITESKVYGIFYSRAGISIRLENEEIFLASDIGKTVFLTRPEAELALAEMEGKK